MGGSSEQSSSTNSNFNNTSNNNVAAASHSILTPTNPAFVSSGLGSLGSNLTSLGGSDPYSFVAPANSLETQAGTNASALTANPAASRALGAGLDETGYVMNAAAPHTSGTGANGFINQYMNPYTNSVVNASLAGFDNNANLTREQQNLDLAGDSTFGGSGGAIEKALTEGQLGLARGQLESGLRDQGFNTAIGAANNDANRYQGAKDLNAQLYGQQMDRALGAAGQLQSLSSGYDANQRANIGAQGTMGDLLRQIQQQQAQAPLSTNASLSSMWGSLPLGLLNGHTADDLKAGSSTSASSGTANSATNQSGSNIGLSGSDAANLALAAFAMFG